MKSLTEFPEEVLAQIFAGELNSHLVIQLWKCGSRVLNKKLAHSVRSVDLKDETPFSTSRWPKCLSSFTKLHSLSISLPSGYLMASAVDLVLELLALSSSLERFSIDSKDCIFIVDGELPPHHSSVNVDSANGSSQYSEAFRSLRSLKLGSALAFRPQAPFFRLMSAHIRELIIPSYNAEQHADPTLGKLPPKLEFLNTGLVLDECDVSSKIFSQCPPSLMRVQSIDIGDNSNEAMEALPEGLKIGELKCRDVIWDYDFSVRLPPGVESIEIFEIDYESFEAQKVHWAENLPSNVIFTLQDQTYHPDFLRQLPIAKARSLFVRLDYTEPIKFLPPVASLSLYGKNLISIEVPFPNTITSLSLAAVGGGGVLHPRDFSLLPPSLLSLKVTWFDNSIGEFDESLVVLPSGLQSLYVDRWNLSWFAKLPRSLTDLGVELVDGFTDPEVDPTVDYFRALPTGLKRLLLGKNSRNITTPLPGCSFSQLHDLVYLNLYEYSHFDSSVLRTVYHGMKKLKELKLAMVSISPQDAPFLAPWLRKAVFRDLTDPVPEVFDHWPESATVWLQPEIAGPLSDRIQIAKKRAFMYPDPRITIP